MAIQADVRLSSVYLVLERATWKWDAPKVVSMRKEKPQLKSGQIAVKVSLGIDMDMFNTFIPEVITELKPTQIIPPVVVLEEETVDA